MLLKELWVVLRADCWREKLRATRVAAVLATRSSTSCCLCSRNSWGSGCIERGEVRVQDRRRFEATNWEQNPDNRSSPSAMSVLTLHTAAIRRRPGNDWLSG